jgi:acyl carrier protein
MTTKSEIAERLRVTVAKELRQDVTAVTQEQTLRDDLGLNSLDAIELMFKIEEEFDLSIPDEDVQTLITVGDVIAYLEGRLNQRTPAKAHCPTTPKQSTASPPKVAPRLAKDRKGKGSRGHA